MSSNKWNTWTSRSDPKPCIPCTVDSHIISQASRVEVSRDIPTFQKVKWFILPTIRIVIHTEDRDPRAIQLGVGLSLGEAQRNVEIRPAFGCGAFTMRFSSCFPWALTAANQETFFGFSKLDPSSSLLQAHVSKMLVSSVSSAPGWFCIITHPSFQRIYC